MSTSLTSQLTQSLRDELLNGTFRPGQQLRLNQLSQQFHVSLSPLREALSRLAAEGLVIAQDQRGYQAAPVSVRNHQEITELRTMLEPHALRISMQQGGEDWEVAVLAAHHRLQQVEKRAASDPEALAEWEIRHREFHLMLIGGGQMPVLAQFCEKLLAFSAASSCASVRWTATFPTSTRPSCARPWTATRRARANCWPSTSGARRPISPSCLSNGSQATKPPRHQQGAPMP